MIYICFRDTFTFFFYIYDMVGRLRRRVKDVQRIMVLCCAFATGGVV